MRRQFGFAFSLIARLLKNYYAAILASRFSFLVAELEGIGLACMKVQQHKYGGIFIEIFFRHVEIEFCVVWMKLNERFLRFSHPKIRI